MGGRTVISLGGPISQRFPTVRWYGNLAGKTKTEFARLNYGKGSGGSGGLRVFSAPVRLFVRRILRPIIGAANKVVYHAVLKPVRAAVRGARALSVELTYRALGVVDFDLLNDAERRWLAEFLAPWLQGALIGSLIHGTVKVVGSVRELYGDLKTAQRVVQSAESVLPKVRGVVYGLGKLATGALAPSAGVTASSPRVTPRLWMWQPFGLPIQ